MRVGRQCECWYHWRDRADGGPRQVRVRCPRRGVVPIKPAYPNGWIRQIMWRLAPYIRLCDACLSHYSRPSR